MKKQLTIIIGLLLSSSITVHAQVAQKLRELGMENIRTIETGGTTVAAFEDNVYRGTYRGVGKAIIAGMEGMGNGNLELVALDGNGIPQLSISLPDTLIAGYKSGEISLKEVYERMEMSYDTDRPMGLLKGSTGVINRSAWKADIVLYPEVSLETVFIQSQSVAGCRNGLVERSESNGTGGLPHRNQHEGRIQKDTSGGNDDFTGNKVPE